MKPYESRPRKSSLARTGTVMPFATVTPLDGITARAGEGVEVRYRSGSDVAAAVALARDADVVIVFGADKASEGGDKTCLSLSCPLAVPPEARQDELIEAVLAANPRSTRSSSSRRAVRC